MKVILEPVSGTAKDNLDRVRLEIAGVLNVRGSVTSVKTMDTRIIVEFEINPQWYLPHAEKESYLRECITAKVRTIFKVLSVSA